MKEEVSIFVLRDGLPPSPIVVGVSMVSDEKIAEISERHGVDREYATKVAEKCEEVRMGSRGFSSIASLAERYHKEGNERMEKFSKLVNVYASPPLNYREHEIVDHLVRVGSLRQD